MNLDDLRKEIEELDAKMRSALYEENGDLRADVSDETREQVAADLKERNAKFALFEQHKAIADAAQLPERTVAGKVEAPNVNIKRDAFDVLEDRSAKPMELADAITRSLDGKVDAAENMDYVRKMVKRHARDTDWARNILARSTDLYQSAFSKLASGREYLLTNEERTVLGVTTAANGAYFLPTAIDPTVILTGDLSDNLYRRLARKVTITNGATNWEGITSAGVTASWDGEVVEVSDDSPTFGNPTIPTYRAQAFVQASLSALEDISGLEGDIMTMFAEARDTLEGAAFATGSGSSQPTGVWTAVHAVTASRVTSTTAATIGLVDIHAVYEGVPRRYRSRSTWTMNPVYASAIKELGTAVSASYSGDLSMPTAGRIRGLPVEESDDAPSTQTTTALDDEVLLGDFNQFVVVDRPGSGMIERIPHLFNTTTNLPDGRRGFYFTWRTGSDVTNADAFRVLVDKTSA